MSVKTSAPRRLERFRAKYKGKAVQETPGKGKAVAKAAKVEKIKKALSLKKQSNTFMRELESLDIASLQEKLAETRKELFNLRFKHATGQLENVATLKAHKRQIARILTLIGHKEVGA